MSAATKERARGQPFALPPPPPLFGEGDDVVEDFPRAPEAPDPPTVAPAIAAPVASGAVLQGDSLEARLAAAEARAQAAEAKRTRLRGVVGVLTEQVAASAALQAANVADLASAHARAAEADTERVTAVSLLASERLTAAAAVARLQAQLQAQGRALRAEIADATAAGSAQAVSAARAAVTSAVGPAVRAALLSTLPAAVHDSVTAQVHAAVTVAVGPAARAEVAHHMSECRCMRRDETATHADADVTCQPAPAVDPIPHPPPSRGRRAQLASAHRAALGAAVAVVTRHAPGGWGTGLAARVAVLRGMVDVLGEEVADSQGGSVGVGGDAATSHRDSGDARADTEEGDDDDEDDDDDVNDDVGCGAVGGSGGSGGTGDATAFGDRRLPPVVGDAHNPPSSPSRPVTAAAAARQPTPVTAVCKRAATEAAGARGDPSAATPSAKRPTLASRGMFFGQQHSGGGAVSPMPSSPTPSVAGEAWAAATWRRGRHNQGATVTGGTIAAGIMGGRCTVVDASTALATECLRAAAPAAELCAPKPGNGHDDLPWFTAAAVSSHRLLTLMAAAAAADAALSPRGGIVRGARARCASELATRLRSPMAGGDHASRASGAAAAAYSHGVLCRLLGMLQPHRVAAYDALTTGDGGDPGAALAACAAGVAWPAVYTHRAGDVTTAAMRSALTALAGRWDAAGVGLGAVAARCLLSWCAHHGLAWPNAQTEGTPPPEELARARRLQRVVDAAATR